MNQDFLVFAIIILTTVYVTYSFIKGIRARKINSGCNGCTGCDIAKKINCSNKS